MILAIAIISGIAFLLFTCAVGTEGNSKGEQEVGIWSGLFFGAILTLSTWYFTFILGIIFLVLSIFIWILAVIRL